MKLQSVEGALPTEQLFLNLDDALPDDEGKIDGGASIALLLELAVSLGGCGLLHWIMT